MTTLIQEVYDAFRSVGVDDAKAQAAAAALSLQEDRLSRLERDIAVLKWMVGSIGGINITLTIGVLARLLFVHP